MQFVVDNIYYHSISIILISVIIASIWVNKFGSSSNMEIATKYKEILHPSLKSWFVKYNGDLVVESPNVIKIYASGRKSCLFAIIAFAVKY